MHAGQCAHPLVARVRHGSGVEGQHGVGKRARAGRHQRQHQAQVALVAEGVQQPDGVRVVHGLEHGHV